MSSKKNAYTWVVKAGIGLAVAGIAYYIYERCIEKNRKTLREHMVAEFYDNVRKPIPYNSHTNADHYALWIVPGVQPELSSVVRKYGGYHIKLMNMQPINLPQNFSLDAILQKFPSDVNHRWNMMLPDIHVRSVHTKSHISIMVIEGATTLNMLRRFFQTPAGGSWKHLHLTNNADASINKDIDKFNYITLGSDDPYDQAKPSDFTYQTQWYVQLVKGPKYEWIHNQRVMLYAAQGLEG